MYNNWWQKTYHHFMCWKHLIFFHCGSATKSWCARWGPDDDDKFGTNYMHIYIHIDKEVCVLFRCELITYSVTWNFLDEIPWQSYENSTVTSPINVSHPSSNTKIKLFLSAYNYRIFLKEKKRSRWKISFLIQQTHLWVIFLFEKYLERPNTSRGLTNG